MGRIIRSSIPLDERLDLLECSWDAAEGVYRKLITTMHISHGSDDKAAAIITIIAEAIDGSLRPRLG